jgi:hypothetical protein
MSSRQALARPNQLTTARRSRLAGQLFADPPRSFRGGRGVLIVLRGVLVLMAGIFAAGHVLPTQ